MGKHRSSPFFLSFLFHDQLQHMDLTGCCRRSQWYADEAGGGPECALLLQPVVCGEPNCRPNPVAGQRGLRLPAWGLHPLTPRRLLQQLIRASQRVVRLQQLLPIQQPELGRLRFPRPSPGDDHRPLGRDLQVRGGCAIQCLDVSNLSIYRIRHIQILGIWQVTRPSWRQRFENPTFSNCCNRGHPFILHVRPSTTHIHIRVETNA